MKEKFLLFLLPRIFKAVLTVIGWTCKIRWENEENLQQLYGKDKPWILTFWHENVLIIPWLLRDHGITCMVSDSRDGEYIARAGLVFGNQVIRGSSSKGSAKATRSAVRLLRANQPVAITPDGPRGPAHKLQTGALWLAAMCDAAILPLHIEVDRQWRFKSWDGQKIPKPFSTIYVSTLAPRYIDKNYLKEPSAEVNQSIEDYMMENTNRARRLAGYPEC